MRATPITQAFTLSAAVLLFGCREQQVQSIFGPDMLGTPIQPTQRPTDCLVAARNFASHMTQRQARSLLSMDRQMIERLCASPSFGGIVESHYGVADEGRALVTSCVGTGGTPEEATRAIVLKAVELLRVSSELEKR